MWGRRDRFHQRDHAPFTICCLLLLFCGGAFFLLSDCDCDDGDPCTINTCVGICLTSRVDNCCQSNRDCTDTLCNQGLCDTLRSQCVLQPYKDDVACDDQDVCTVDDGCLAGQCVGVAINCTHQECQACACDPVLGCQYVNLVDGATCHLDTCTTSTCLAGACHGVPMDCTHLDDHCGLGQCVDSACVYVPGVDGTMCDDGQHCTSSDHCEAGVCVGVERQCFDTDPCTLNMCIEHVQSCVALPVQTHTCQFACMHDVDCEVFDWVVGDIQCRDGSCVQISSDPSTVIRFLEYDLQECAAPASYRMAMFFLVETALQRHEQRDYYRIATQPSDVQGTFPVGFGEALDIQPSIFTGYTGVQRGQTSFTLHTDCKDLSQECFQFTDRYYAFSVLLHDCLYNSGWQHCLDATSQLDMYFNLSVSDCPLREHIVQTHVDGTVLVDSTAHLYLPTRALLTVSAGNPWMTDIRICVPKQGSLERCVLNTATQPCPNVGCFDWGESESEALQDSWDLMEDGSPTAFAAVDALAFQTCHHHEDYVDPKCTSNIQHSWCNGTDGFSAVLYMLEPYVEREIMIDIKFASHFCGRRLNTKQVQVQQVQRELSKIMIV